MVIVVAGIRSTQTGGVINQVVGGRCGSGNDDDEESVNDIDRYTVYTSRGSPVTNPQLRPPISRHNENGRSGIYTHKGTLHMASTTTTHELLALTRRSRLGFYSSVRCILWSEFAPLRAANHEKTQTSLTLPHIVPFTAAPSSAARTNGRAMGIHEQGVRRYWPHNPANKLQRHLGQQDVALLLPLLLLLYDCYCYYY